MKYAGMTVNERLFMSGLLKDFDSAKEKKDKNRLIEILRSLEVDEASIQQILKDFEAWAQDLFIIQDKADSEVAGAHGNLERFYLLKKL